MTADDGDTSNNIGYDYVTVSVHNVAPTVALSGPTSADEGQTKHYTFTTTDPGQDTFTLFSVSCGTNGTVVAPASFNTTSGAGSFDCSFPDGPSSSSVAVQVKDSDGAASNMATTDVTVANVAPTVHLSGANSADEGQTKTYNYTVSDPGNDPGPTITEECGSNGTYTDTLAPNSLDEPRMMLVKTWLPAGGESEN